MKTSVIYFIFFSPLQMGVEGVDEGASGAQHSRKLVSFTLSGKEQHYSVFYKLLLKKNNCCFK